MEERIKLLNSMCLPLICVMQRKFRLWRVLCELFIFVEYNKRDENAISIFSVLHFNFLSIF